ncbi:hypothetical protein OG474_38635 [Kribbella sp. NBC_01505]|uniref:hypothetical protein n=1 Tax=Kribbella sp. NBC_01505 TaxID=2903580 RepID=UPI0038658915
MTPDVLPQRRRVKVWFGEHAIAEFINEQAVADRYADAMRRRFQSLRVTNESIPDDSTVSDSSPR